MTAGLALLVLLMALPLYWAVVASLTPEAALFDGAVGKDTLEIRKLNFYGTEDRNVTPYHQTVEDNIIHRVVTGLGMK